MRFELKIQMAKLNHCRPKFYNHWANLSRLCYKGIYDIFDIINKSIILHQKFQFSNLNNFSPQWVFQVSESL